MDKLRKLPEEEWGRVLLDTGVLYAANELIFHPLGLQVAVDMSGPSQAPPKLIVQRTCDGNPATFYDEETRRRGREKLLKFLRERKPAFTSVLFEAFNVEEGN